MKKLFFPIAIVAFALLSFTAIEHSTWSLDQNHSKLGFSITHMMLADVEGSFKITDATITSSMEDFSDAVVFVQADVKSVNTENDQRDEHLRTADFFDATKYPVLTFKSTSFQKVGDNKYKVTGDLTLHGVTKQVVLEASARTGVNPYNQQVVAGFKVTGSVKRTDFGIAATTPSAMISDEVVIEANVEFIKNNAVKQ